MTGWRQTLVENIGEDSVRYLDRPLLQDDESDAELLLARIRGIDRIETASAFLAAERRLGNPDEPSHREECPRETIVDLLEERLAFLRTNGERPADIRAALEADDVDVPNRYWPSRQLPNDVESEPTDYPDVFKRLEALVKGFRGSGGSRSGGSTTASEDRSQQATLGVATGGSESA